MARSTDLEKVERVNGIRKRRLVQALAESRLEADRASDNEARAARHAEAAGERLSEARQAFLADPANPQSALWRDVSSDKEHAARDARAAASARLAEAKADVRGRAHALARHEMKSDTIRTWGSQARVEEQRAAERRGEDDVVPGRGVR